jgi:hypothetical protein
MTLLPLPPECWDYRQEEIKAMMEVGVNLSSAIYLKKSSLLRASSSHPNDVEG